MNSAKHFIHKFEGEGGWKMAMNSDHGHESLTTFRLFFFFVGGVTLPVERLD